MIVYITRKHSGEINRRGLQSLQVWLRKPHYQKVYRTGTQPFGPEDGEMGIYTDGYELHYGPYQSDICFSELFGYSDTSEQGRDEIAAYVWRKLKEHFLNAPFDDWEKLEADKKVHISEFLLELDIDISFKTRPPQDVSPDTIPQLNRWILEQLNFTPSDHGDMIFYSSPDYPKYRGTFIKFNGMFVFGEVDENNVHIKDILIRTIRTDIEAEIMVDEFKKYLKENNKISGNDHS